MTLDALEDAARENDPLPFDTRQPTIQDQIALMASERRSNHRIQSSPVSGPTLDRVWRTLPQSLAITSPSRRLGPLVVAVAPEGSWEELRSYSREFEGPLVTRRRGSATAARGLCESPLA